MTIDNERINSLLAAAIPAALQAGDAILDVYNSSFTVELKEDRSPITRADRRSHAIIKEGLAATRLPFLSEEGREIPYAERKGWGLFWLVDPLDGTKEFVKRNGEFTVNIALIDGMRPVAGVIYVPVKDLLYAGAFGVGAFRFDTTVKLRSVAAAGNLAGDLAVHDATPLPLPAEKRDATIIVASRSHLSAETQACIDRCRQVFGEIEQTSRGSSLKLCLIAEASADIYPRFSPTMAWDIAAGHAIVEAAGGTVRQVKGPALDYNGESLVNPWFIAARPGLDVSGFYET